MYRVASVLLVALVVVLAVGPVGEAEPPTLAERAAAIERVSTERDGARVVIGHLSRKLRTPVDELQTQRERTGLGWGELLIANLIAKTTNVTFDQIVGEFRSGKSWEGIARDHRVNVDRLADDVDRSQEIVEGREEDKAPAVSSDDGSRRRGSTARRPGGDASAGSGRERHY